MDRIFFYFSTLECWKKKYHVVLGHTRIGYCGVCGIADGEREIII